MPNLPISQLSASSALDGTELLVNVQGGVTKKQTIQDILNADLPVTSSGITVGDGSITPTTPQGATLGTAEKPFRELYLQSGSISIESNTPGEPSATISNFSGNVDIRAAGFSVSSGSTTPFEITQEGLTVIKTPTPQIGKAIVNVTSNPSSTIFPLAASTAGGVFQGTGGTVGPTILTLDNFNNTPAIAAGGLVIGRRFRGTPDAPTQALDGDQLTIFAGLPYNGGTIVGGSFSSMQFKALGDTTPSSAATSWELNLVPTGSNIPQKVIEAITDRVTILGSVSASTYYGDGSNLTGIEHPTGSLVSKAYGSFFDTTTQSGSADTAYAVKHNTTDFGSGVSIVSDTRITMAEAGVYTIISTQQFVHTEGGTVTITGWLRKNGTDVPNSATDLRLKGNNEKDLYAINYFVSSSAGDYYELIWSASDSDTEIQYTAARTSPTRPAVPSVITTVNRVG